MSDLLIQQLFERRAAEFARANGMDLVSENAQDPEASSYLRFTLLPAGSDSPDLAGEIEIFTGVVQLDVARPSGEGSGEARRIVELLKLAFPINLELFEGAFKVTQLTKLSASPAFTESNRYTVPTRLRYRASTGP